MSKQIKTLVLFFVLFFPASLMMAQSPVLVEVLTNAHCSYCPNAHHALEDFISGSPQANRVYFLFYHMRFPYPDDSLYLANTTDPANRAAFYGNYFSTPITFFNGIQQQNQYAQWPEILNQELNKPAQLSGTLQLRKTGEGYEASVQGAALNGFSAESLLFVFAISENVLYQGRNGIKRHINVLRKFVTPPSGVILNLQSGAYQIQRSFLLQNNWNPDSLSVTFFLQDPVTKRIVYATSELLSAVSGAEVNEDIDKNFQLKQNFPNPFNPATTIEFVLPKATKAAVRIFNMQGQLIATPAEGYLAAGPNTVRCNLSDFPSGVYFYQLITPERIITKKMILLK